MLLHAVSADCRGQQYAHRQPLGINLGRMVWIRCYSSSTLVQGGCCASTRSHLEQFHRLEAQLFQQQRLSPRKKRLSRIASASVSCISQCYYLETLKERWSESGQVEALCMTEHFRGHSSCCGHRGGSPGVSLCVRVVLSCSFQGCSPALRCTAKELARLETRS
jgi:hypothetical protein